jgi:purine-binding chemotaxis protein CheW
MAGSPAATLRDEFDRSFALPVATSSPVTTDLLAIRVAGRPFALFTHELGGVAVERRVTPVPSPDPALAGLVAVRGTLVGLFDLGVLFGLRASAVAGRWVALAANDVRLAFAFDELEGHLRVETAALRDADTERSDFVRHTFAEQTRVFPVASVAALVLSLSERVARESSRKGS